MVLPRNWSRDPSYSFPVYDRDFPGFGRVSVWQQAPGCWAVSIDPHWLKTGDKYPLEVRLGGTDAEPTGFSLTERTPNAAARGIEARLAEVVPSGLYAGATAYRLAVRRCTRAGLRRRVAFLEPLPA